MKTKTILLLTALCASAVNFPAHAQDYGPLIVDGTAHPAETGTTYQATTDTPPLTVQNNGGSYIGTNITLINNNAPTGSIPTDSGAYIINQGQLSLTNSNITAQLGTLLAVASGTLNNVTINAEMMGVWAQESTLNLTGGKITTTMAGADPLSYSGISLQAASHGTLNNVTIEAAQTGIVAMYNSTLDLTGGNITLNGAGSMGILLLGSAATVSGVNIDSEAISMGVQAAAGSTLTLADSTLTTTYSGVMLNQESSGTLNNVNITTTMDNDESGYGNGVNILNSSTLTLTGGKIETSGSAAHGIAFAASTGTLTNVNITATGQDANALHLVNTSTATANLSNNTLTGGITADGNSQLTLTASNATTLTGDITTTDHSTVNLTLTGEGSKLVGNLTQDTTSTITLDISDGATLGDATIANTINGTVNIHDGGHISTTLTLANGITLETGAILDYALNETGLQITSGALAIGETILVDLSALTETGLYLILDWTNATPTGEITDTQFNNATPGVEGTFTVANNQLTFTATTIPEPSVYFLLGIGIALLLLTAHHRRRNQS